MLNESTGPSHDDVLQEKLDNLNYAYPVLWDAHDQTTVAGC